MKLCNLFKFSSTYKLYEDYIYSNIAENNWKIQYLRLSLYEHKFYEDLLAAVVENQNLQVVDLEFYINEENAHYYKNRVKEIVYPHLHRQITIKLFSFFR